MVIVNTVQAKTFLAKNVAASECNPEAKRLGLNQLIVQSENQGWLASGGGVIGGIPDVCTLCKPVSHGHACM